LSVVRWQATQAFAIAGGLLFKSRRPVLTALAYEPFTWCGSRYPLAGPWQLSQETPAFASPRNTVAWQVTHDPFTS
jgi:hypothetical protein